MSGVVHDLGSEIDRLRRTHDLDLVAGSGGRGKRLKNAGVMPIGGIMAKNAWLEG